jgi:hypothetical protein
MLLRSLAPPAALIALLVCMTSLSVAAADRDRDRRRAEEGRWVELGSRQVDFKSDHDTIEVGKAEGRFTALRVNVEDGDLVMEKMKVTFGDGSTFEPKTRLEFREGTTAQTIDLPNKSHVIKRVDFVYHTKRKREKATVMLYGKES